MEDLMGQSEDNEQAIVEPAATMDEIQDRLEDRMGSEYDEPEDEAPLDFSDEELAQPAPQQDFSRQHQIESQYAGVVQAEQQLQAQYQATDWQSLRQDDPGEFAARQAEMQHQHRQIAHAKQQLEAGYSEITKGETARHQQNMAQHASKEEARLLRSIPTWQNAKVRAKESALVRDYLKNQGFSDKDIAGAVDHKMVVMARQAALYQRGNSSKLKQKVQTKKTKPKVTYSKYEKQVLERDPGSSEAIALRLERIL